MRDFEAKLMRALSTLERAGLIEFTADGIKVTEKGVERARQIKEASRSRKAQAAVRASSAAS